MLENNGFLNNLIKNNVVELKYSKKLFYHKSYESFL